MLIAYNPFINIYRTTIRWQTLARRKGPTRTSLGYQAKQQVNAYVDIKQ